MGNQIVLNKSQFESDFTTMDHRSTSKVSASNRPHSPKTGRGRVQHLEWGILPAHFFQVCFLQSFMYCLETKVAGSKYRMYVKKPSASVLMK